MEVVTRETRKKELLVLREELMARVERTHRHLFERKERVSADFSEQSQELENQDLVTLLDAEGRNELRLIDQALDRIENGQYGICQHCGEDINAERLAAIPYARYCIACADKMES